MQTGNIVKDIPNLKLSNQRRGQASEAAYQKAKKYYETLKDTGGIDPDELALAQTTMKRMQNFNLMKPKEF